MNNFLIAWREKIALYEKIVFIIGFFCSILVIIFGILQITGLLENAINIAQPLLGVVMVSQGILQWKKSKKVSVFSFAVAGFIFCVAIIIFMIR